MLTGVLISGGLDSAILLGSLARQAQPVQPIHIVTDACWSAAEQQNLDKFLGEIACPPLRPLVRLEMPLGDLYGDHWSLSGVDPPDAGSPDEAVFLPGRNALLSVKAVVWCQLNNIPRLALATLGTSPFPDASTEFFEAFQVVATLSGPRPIQILRPFAHQTKRDVMRMAGDLPLGLTFSCIAPVEGQHCGRCNKCGERRKAFSQAGIHDPTQYADLRTTTDVSCVP
jgi:7-cyano-7-deazaguanine synthase